MLRSLAALALSLVPTVLLAQAAISPKSVLYGPYTPVDPMYDRLAIAGDANGAAVAWTDASDGYRLSVMKVGTNVKTDILPEEGLEGAPLLPSLAKRGDTYLLAWVDPAPGMFFNLTESKSRLAYARLDANAHLLDSPLPGTYFRYFFSLLADVKAVPAADGFHIFKSDVGTEETIIGASGAAVSRDVPVMAMNASSAAIGSQATVFANRYLVSMLLISPPPPSDFYVASRVNGSAPATTFHQQMIPFINGDSAIAWNGSEFLVAWRAGVVLAMRLDANGTPIGQPFELAGVNIPYDVANRARIEVAWDGNEWVVVWDEFSAGRGDIFGRMIGADGSLLTPKLFVAATAEDDERMPALTGLGGGRSLVAYQVLDDAHRATIVTRTITSAKGRARAVRSQ